MPELPPDIRILAEALSAENVRWVLVGGAALVLHGGEITTTDSDVAFALDVENKDALAAALNRIHARPTRMALDAPFKADRFLLGSAYIRVHSDAGVIDLMGRLPGVDSFLGLYERADVVTMGAITFRVASLDDLVAMKSQSDRPKDKVHLMELQALKNLRGDANPSVNL